MTISTFTRRSRCGAALDKTAGLEPVDDPGDASNITGIIDRLEARGLVERRAGERDRRVKVLIVTDRGLELRRRLLVRMAEPPEPIARLSPDDQRALTAILRRALTAR